MFWFDCPLSKESKTSAIKFPIKANSLEPKPLVVAAADPNRIPEVIVGGKGSNGIPFLLQVKPAFSKAISAFAPVIFLLFKLNKTI